MKVDLKALAAAVREVWSLPAGRAWGIADMRILKLLKAIEDGTDDALRARFEAELRVEKARARAGFDVADALAAFDRAVDTSRPRGGESAAGERR